MLRVLRQYSTKSTEIKTITKVSNVFNSKSSSYKPKLRIEPGLVYHPAPSAPTYKQTPNAFLPQSDPRRSLQRPVHSETEIQHMPLLNPLGERKYHLTEKEITEIQKLRNESPNEWTKKKLAAKFGCSEQFISLCSDVHPARKAEMDERLNIIQSRWGVKRAKFRDDRTKRRQYWLRDE